MRRSRKEESKTEPSRYSHSSPTGQLSSPIYGEFAPTEWARPRRACSQSVPISARVRSTPLLVVQAVNGIHIARSDQLITAAAGSPQLTA